MLLVDIAPRFREYFQIQTFEISLVLISWFRTLVCCYSVFRSVSKSSSNSSLFATFNVVNFAMLRRSGTGTRPVVFLQLLPVSFHRTVRRSLPLPLVSIAELTLAPLLGPGSGFNQKHKQLPTCSGRRPIIYETHMYITPSLSRYL